ncbi:potassium transporter Kup [Mesorhizobium sp. INR15]|uniref:potassium transporter Kup n=1 Tax=Mesorhizobium sp. INR15 TaxID=2654248 RepID=UPI0018969271|nr:potassium transporter Kup [Mesorhizobium sp. INR15]QPC95400.1 potassium transporter Kup [Mesorhizobium sp. INR15]
MNVSTNGVSSDHAPHRIAGASTPKLVLAALGVVFGDIGTSPIYAFREALHASAGGAGPSVSDMNVFGLLSLIVWALLIVVTLKYVTFVLRADNNGEGGTLSLMALARGKRTAHAKLILVLGVCGASLFFGDAIITPAISVLSAVEGLKVITPGLDSLVIPITLAILVVLMFAQRFGTGKVANVFGPVTAIWFLVLGLSGLTHIADAPSILLAVNPYYAVHYLTAQPEIAFVTMGSVFLAVTGAEALYVDLGHFGRRPIVLAWLAIVFPCLLLNYFGQGAFVISMGGNASNPFFNMLPEWFLIPGVILATAATVIASQAVISGAFSLTSQAVQLHMLPRFTIRHTSETQAGQIYLPRVNFLIAIGVMLLVVGFRESSALASAYGISVTGEMLVTTILLLFVMRRRWRWGLAVVLPLILFFAVIDAGFLLTNAVKVLEGGWVSVGVACVMGLIMSTWITGTKYLFNKARKSEISLELLATKLAEKPPSLVPGTAIFLTSDPQSAPAAMMHSLKHYRVLHEQNIIMTVVTAEVPRVADQDRISIEPVNELFTRIIVTFGFIEQPNIPGALAICRKQGLKFDIMATSFFVSRRSLKASPDSGLPLWQDRLFIFLASTASDATEYFRIPADRVVEIGSQIII